MRRWTNSTGSSGTPSNRTRGVPMANVLITGAAGGIGRALVTRFSAAGYDVVGVDCRERPAELACRNYLAIDLARTVEDEIYAKQQFEAIINCLNGKGLRALINNAAIQILGGVDSLTRADWRQTLDINLVAPFLWTQALLGQLESARGSVINISSIHARLTKQNFVAYATSKAALSGMTRAMAVDLGGRVRVNAIEPAAIETLMLKEGFAHNPELYAQLEACHPQGRIGTPEEVAKLALAMIDDGLQFMHGTNIMLDGGISARLYDPD